MSTEIDSKADAAQDSSSDTDAAATDSGRDAGPSPAAITLRPLTLADPFRWLALGWRDFRRSPLIGLFYGAAFVAMGWALAAVYRNAPAYVLALAAGFLLTGPILSLGLYHASRALERAEAPSFVGSLFAFESRLGPLAIFGFVLLVLEMLWGRATLVLFAVSFDGMPDFKGSVLALLDPQNLHFILGWIAVGAIFAGLIFAVSVISIPMLLDRPVDAITAGLTSLRLVLAQPVVMLLWGAVVTVLVAAAMLPWFAGLLVVGPVVGHASWHAYRAAVA
jgi:uncharacterized membrane protein